MCLTSQAGFESLGIIEEQFPKLLLDGREAAASPKGHAADAVGKVGQRLLSFVLLFCNHYKLTQSTQVKAFLYSNPLQVKTDVREALGLKSFSKSTNPLPKTSYVPYCFFDKVYHTILFSYFQSVCRAQKTFGPFQNMGRSCSGEIRLWR